MNILTRYLLSIQLILRHRFLTDHCWTVAKIYRGIELDEIVNREDNLPLHIDELRNAIFDVYNKNALVNSYSIHNFFSEHCLVPG